MSSHFIDCHHVQRLAVSPEEFVNEGRIWRKGYAYQIPYRVITPKTGECGNLLVPVDRLQKKLRTGGQVVDFVPGEPEKCEDLNGPPEF